VRFQVLTAESTAPMMETVRTSETVVNFYEPTRHSILEHFHFQLTFNLLIHTNIAKKNEMYGTFISIKQIACILINH
jgi:hypothetical protein